MCDQKFQKCHTLWRAPILRNIGLPYLVSLTIASSRKVNLTYLYYKLSSTIVNALIVQGGPDRDMAWLKRHWSFLRRQLLIANNPNVRLILNCVSRKRECVKVTYHVCTRSDQVSMVMQKKRSSAMEMAELEPDRTGSNIMSYDWKWQVPKAPTCHYN